MINKIESILPQQENLEDLKFQLASAEEQHAQLLQTLENLPKEPGIQVEIDKTYDRLSEIKRKIFQFEEKKENK
jgi:hypothetical protein